MISTVKGMVEDSRFQEAMDLAKRFRDEMKEKAKKYFKQAAVEEIERAEALITEVETELKLDLSSEKKGFGRGKRGPELRGL